MRNLSLKTGLSTLLLFLTGTSTAMSANTDKFEWRATESAPQHYPMKIINGAFLYHDGSGSLYIPDGGTISSGWGHGISNHLDDEKYKPLPNFLRITFFSYAEKQFYEGFFNLPYDKILALFRDGVENPYDFGNGKTLPMYSKMMAGIAPGGVVAVWVAGKKQHEVFFGQAQKIELNPGSAFKVPFKDKQDADQYIKDVLADVLRPEELASLKKDGVPFGLWARYRKLYNWGPTARTGESLRASIFYLNGEYFGHELGGIGGCKRNDRAAPGAEAVIVSFSRQNPVRSDTRRIRNPGRF